jgi:hypothetical protein
MKTTKTTPATYTHVGCRASTGYVHCSKDGYTHNEPKAGKRHALNVGVNGFVAVCGETVSTYSADHRCDERNPVEAAPDAAGTRVTCARCRKLLKVPKYAVQFKSLYCSKWSTAKGHGQYATKAEAEAGLAALKTEFPHYPLRVRLV